VTSLSVNAPGPLRPAPRGRRTAFTLVEILLVISLLGMIALVLVNSASDLFRSHEPRPDDVFWSAVTAARQLALEGSQTVTLRYDQEKRTLTWAAAPETARSLTYPGRLLEFLPVTGSGTVLLGGQLAETGSLPLIRFFPDGSCDAFRAQLTDATGRRVVLAIDQWTCAPMLAAETAK